MITISQRQRTFGSYATDVLIYVVVLNLFVEYADAIVIDSFTISIFTAVVLKILLDFIMGVEHRVSHYFAQRDRPMSKIIRVVATWSILFLSKFLILEVIDIVFGDHVELGGFLQVLTLVITMMIAQAVFQKIYESLRPTSQPVE
jgi:hypothetical protein